MTIGPLITLIVFVPGKKGLAFDLTVVAILQITALAFGVWVLFESRPVYFVFVKDRFELVRANDIPEEELAKASRGPFARLPLAGPQLVGAKMPTDRAERERIMFAGAAGVDLQLFPQHYVPYDDQKADAKARGDSIAKLRKLNPGATQRIDRLIAEIGRREEEIRFLPMRAGKIDLTVLIAADTGAVLRIANLRPWEY